MKELANHPRKWMPEIMYEEYEGMTEHIPFIQIPAGFEMPDVIFIFGSQGTGEFEPNEDGEEEEIVEMELYQYACMQYLKEGLDKKTYDKVRICLGLQQMDQAVEKGTVLSQELINNIENR